MLNLWKGVLCGALLLTLVGCQSNSGLAVADTCQTNAVVVSTLADFKSKLSDAQVKAVDNDIAAIDPICSAPTPPATLIGAAAVAAQDLANILSQVQK